MLDAGAFFRDFIVGVDTPCSAMTKLLGATRGGGEFKAVPTWRTLEIDGAPSGVRGGDRIDSWDVGLTANLLEATPETSRLALGAGAVDSDTNPQYIIIKGKNYVEDGDYLDNITWIGTLSGSDDPVIIQVFNAFSTSGLTFTPTDKNEAVFKVEFQGRTAMSCSCASASEPPFAIYYPKEITLPAPCVNPVYSGDTEVTGRGAVGATVAISGGTLETPVMGPVDADGAFAITITPQETGARLIISQSVGEEQSDEAIITVLPEDLKPKEVE